MPDLTTSERVREYAGVVSTTNGDALAHIIAAVSAEIVAYCNQPIVSTQVVYRFGGDGGALIVLPFFPVTAITELSYVSGLGAEAVVVPTTDYAISRGRLISNGFVDGYDYTLTLTVGYAAVPADVEQVAVEMCAVRLRDSGIGDSAAKLGQNTLGVRSKAVTASGAPTKSTVYERPEWAVRLAPYRVVTI